MKVVELAAGNEACPLGGALVHSGIDDGAGGGVADDGTLDDGEIRSTTPLCAVAHEAELEVGGASCAQSGAGASPLLALAGLAMLRRRRQR
jgi:uncharacterized protein (TIGR03382 family)